MGVLRHEGLLLSLILKINADGRWSRIFIPGSCLVKPGFYDKPRAETKVPLGGFFSNVFFNPLCLREEPKSLSPKVGSLPFDFLPWRDKDRWVFWGSAWSNVVSRSPETCAEIKIPWRGSPDENLCRNENYLSGFLISSPPCPQGVWWAVLFCPFKSQAFLIVLLCVFVPFLCAFAPSVEQIEVFFLFHILFVSFSYISVFYLFSAKSVECLNPLFGFIRKHCRKMKAVLDVPQKNSFPGLRQLNFNSRRAHHWGPLQAVIFEHKVWVPTKWVNEGHRKERVQRGGTEKKNSKKVKQSRNW